MDTNNTNKRNNEVWVKISNKFVDGLMSTALDVGGETLHLTEEQKKLYAVYRKSICNLANEILDNMKVGDTSKDDGWVTYNGKQIKIKDFVKLYVFFMKG